MNRLNKGTRSTDHPEGHPPLPREALGNRQARVVSELCKLLHQHQGHFLIENPKGPFLFHSKYMLGLKRVAPLFEVHLHQCQYGLKLPGFDENTFCRKRTTLWTTLSELQSLSRLCPGQTGSHIHQRADGHVRIAGRSVSLAAAAGVYLPGLCARWAECVGCGLIQVGASSIQYD